MNQNTGSHDSQSENHRVKTEAESQQYDKKPESSLE